jgi:serine/threonine protein kinase
MVEVVSSKGVEHLDKDDDNKNSSTVAAGDDESDDEGKLYRKQQPSLSHYSATVANSDSKVKKSSISSKKDRAVDAREGYKGNLFLVLEYISHDLTGLMDVAYKFTEVQVKSIFKQLLEALQYMHDNKYVHRDIKSSNILIDHSFRVKLADFGLARSIEPPILDNLHEYVVKHHRCVFFCSSSRDV